MTDASNNQNAPGAEQGGQPMLLVNAQYVKDLSFENPNAPASLTQQGEGGPNVELAIDVAAGQIQDRMYEVVLSIRAEGTTGENKLFIVEIAYCGVFTLGEVGEDYIAPLLYIEAPRLLFPFARGIISDCVRDGGFPPLLIHPVDFVSLFQQRAAQEAEQAENGNGKAPAASANGGGDNGDNKGGDGQKFEFEL